MEIYELLRQTRCVLPNPGVRRNSSFVNACKYCRKSEIFLIYIDTDPADSDRFHEAAGVFLTFQNNVNLQLALQKCFNNPSGTIMLLMVQW